MDEYISNRLKISVENKFGKVPRTKSDMKIFKMDHKSVFYKIILYFLCFLLVGSGKAQNNIQVEVNCFKFECKCFRCDKTDIYYFPIPKKLKSPPAHIKITTPGYSNINPSETFGLVCEKANSLSYEFYNKVSVPPNYLSWLVFCEKFPIPRLEPEKGCNNNYGGKHDLKVFDPKVEKITFALLKSDVDRAIQSNKDLIQMQEQEKKLNKEKEEAIREKKEQQERNKVEMNNIFNNIFIPGYNNALSQDSSGLDSMWPALLRIAALADAKFDEKISFDEGEFTFIELCQYYALSFLYSGAYQSGIRNIQKIIKANKIFDERSFNCFLGMAYLMDCQTSNASEIFKNVFLKEPNRMTCEYIQFLFDEMRKAHPDVVCIKKNKTKPIMMELRCTNIGIGN